jgi:S-adenosylmethionine hydrolase
VGAIKGVILSICTKARIIDLSHEIKKHNIREGAFYLLSSAKYYPKGTVHLVVIDPGVGSKRKSLIIQTDNYFFVGPDNGVLSLAALADKVQKIIEIENTSYFLKPTSNTFHGRDIYAPIAAHLANNKSLEEFGPLTETWNQMKIPEVVEKKGEISGEIIRIDRFGNLITNIPKRLIENKQFFQRKYMQIEISDQNLKIPLCNSYNEVKIGEFLGIIGSTNFLEISKNQESAADALNARNKEKVTVKKS